MRICVVLRLCGTIRENLKFVKQLTVKDASKLLGVNWNTIPDWNKRPDLIVIGVLQQGVGVNLPKGSNNSMGQNILIDDSDKIWFNRYNQILSCLHPQIEKYHLDLYVNITATVVRCLGDAIGLTEGAEYLISLYEDTDCLKYINNARLNRGLRAIPEKISTYTRMVYITRTLTRVPLFPKKHRKVAVGGTFDHLHSGHKILLAMSLYITSRHLICGVTGSSLQRNKEYHEVLQPPHLRAENVRKYLKLLAPPNLKVQIIELKDPYGPTTVDGSIEAIVATEETIKGCVEINCIRKKLGIKELEIYTADLWGTACDGFRKFGSTALRREILNNSINKVRKIVNNTK